MKDSHMRSLSKAFSWRLLATLMTVIISYFITGKLSFALYIGVIEFSAKIIFFYLHERLWSLIP